MDLFPILINFDENSTPMVCVVSFLTIFYFIYSFVILFLFKNYSLLFSRMIFLRYEIKENEHLAIKKL